MAGAHLKKVGTGQCLPLGSIPSTFNNSLGGSQRPSLLYFVFYDVALFVCFFQSVKGVDNRQTILAPGHSSDKVMVL